MAVRPATTDDLDAVLPLLRAYCDFYECDPSDAGLREMASAVIAAPEDEAFLLVAEDGGEVVGIAVCSWKWSSLNGARITYLDDLYVAEHARGKGHADALIDACADIGRRHGAPVLSWLTGTGNLRAQAVYERTGASSEPFLEYDLRL